MAKIKGSQVKKVEIFRKEGCDTCGKKNAKGGLYLYSKRHPKNDTFGAGDVIFDGFYCSIGCLNEECQITVI